MLKTMCTGHQSVDLMLMPSFSLRHTATNIVVVWAKHLLSSAKGLLLCAKTDQSTYVNLPNKSANPIL